MKKPIFVGLTGLIACGKSTVSNILAKDYNAVIIDADKICHELCEPGKIIYSNLKLMFSHEKNSSKYFNEDDTLNRKALADLMFKNKIAKKNIETMMHKHIKTEMAIRAAQAFIDNVEKDFDRIIIYDAPLLIESGLHKLVSKIIIVDVEPEEQLNRLMNRNGFSEEEAKIRINVMMDRKELLTYADYILDNNGTLEDLKLRIEKIIEDLKKIN